MASPATLFAQTLASSLGSPAVNKRESQRQCSICLEPITPDDLTIIHARNINVNTGRASGTGCFSVWHSECLTHFLNQIVHEGSHKCCCGRAQLNFASFPPVVGTAAGLLTDHLLLPRFGHGGEVDDGDLLEHPVFVSQCQDWDFGEDGESEDGESRDIESEGNRSDHGTETDDDIGDGNE